MHGCWGSRTLHCVASRRVAEHAFERVSSRKLGHGEAAIMRQPHSLIRLKDAETRKRATGKEFDRKNRRSNPTGCSATPIAIECLMPSTPSANRPIFAEPLEVFPRGGDLWGQAMFAPSRLTTGRRKTKLVHSTPPPLGRLRGPTRQNSKPSRRPLAVSSWSVSRICSAFTTSGGGEVVVIMYWNVGASPGNRASSESP